MEALCPTLTTAANRSDECTPDLYSEAFLPKQVSKKIRWGRRV